MRNLGWKDTMTEDWSGAGGYGFWCNKKCAERKNRALALEEQEQMALQQAVQMEAGRESGWSAGKTLGVVAGSIALLTIMVVVIKRAKAKKK